MNTSKRLSLPNPGKRLVPDYIQHDDSSQKSNTGADLGVILNHVGHDTDSDKTYESDTDYNNGKVQYTGPLGTFEYDPKEFKLVDREVPPNMFGNGGTMQYLQYIGEETDGSKIHIPEGLKDGSMMFLSSKIESMPKLPSSLENGFAMFCNCKNLKTADNMIPPSMKDCSYMFADCKNLEKGPSLVPGSVQEAPYMFAMCESMKNTPKLGKGLVNGECMFYNCESLSEEPKIPKTMKSSEYMCSGCTTLQKNADAKQAKQSEKDREKFMKKLDTPSLRQKSSSAFSAVMQVYAMKRMGYGLFTAPMLVHTMRKNGQMAKDFSGGMTALAMSHGNAGLYGLMAMKSSNTSKKNAEAAKQRRSDMIRQYDAEHADAAMGLHNDTKYRNEAVKQTKNKYFSKVDDMSYTEQRPLREQYESNVSYRETILDNLAGKSGGKLNTRTKEQMSRFYQEQISGFTAYYQQAAREIKTGESYPTGADRKKAMAGLDALSEMQMRPLMESAERMQKKYHIFSDEDMRNLDKMAKGTPTGQSYQGTFAERVFDKDAISRGIGSRVQQAADRFASFTQPSGSDDSYSY